MSDFLVVVLAAAMGTAPVSYLAFRSYRRWLREDIRQAIEAHEQLHPHPIPSRHRWSELLRPT